MDICRATLNLRFYMCELFNYFGNFVQTIFAITVPLVLPLFAIISRMHFVIGSSSQYQQQRGSVSAIVNSSRRRENSFLKDPQSLPP